MQVYIYDIDFQENGSPNFLAMRVSSYHKQLGDTVTLLRPKDKLPRHPDRVYIFRTDPSLPKPPLAMLTAPKTLVYGIQYFSNWDPSPTILACRPDYLLYPRGRDKFERSDAVQLSDECGHLLKIRQNDENTETNKDTLITDQHLWSLSKEDLLTALNELKDRKNIYFLYPITLSKIIYDQDLTQAFLDLKLANNRQLDWYNSLPFVEKQVQTVLDFFDQFKDKHPRISVGSIEFYPKPVSTTDIDNFKLMIHTIIWMKDRCWRIKFSKLHSRLDSVYSHYYEILHNWSIQPHLSFFELIAQTPAKRLKMSIEEYYCHPELWTDEMFRAGVELYHHLEDWGFSNPEVLARWQFKTYVWYAGNINWKALLTKELWY